MGPSRLSSCFKLIDNTNCLADYIFRIMFVNARAGDLCSMLLFRVVITSIMVFVELTLRVLKTGK